jgi:hypothetical protein
VVSCAHHKKGFKREYNVFDHQKRRHKLPWSTFVRENSRTTDRLFGDDDGTQTLEFGSPRAESNAGNAEQMEDLNAPSTANYNGDLRSKLHRLRQIRDELDQDIKSIERVLSIMGET